MRLFDKYLLACTNQRIPMPPEWQESLELSLTPVKQSKIMDEAAQAEIMGYKFQQDDYLKRGFVNQQVKSLELDEKAKYLLQLYLRALKDHKGLDFLPYLQLGTQDFKSPHYITTAPVIEGREYSIYGNSGREVTCQLYLDGSEGILAEKVFDSLSTLKPRVISTQCVYTEEAQEFLMLKVISYSPVSIVEGTFPPLPSEVKEKDGERYLVPVFRANTLQVVGGSVPCWPLRLPSVAYKPFLDYADKLIPALLDMQVTEDSPTKLKELLANSLPGSTTEEQIKINTLGLYDVDQYIGGKLIW